MQKTLARIIKYPEYIFLVIGFIFGLFILFLTPPNEVADELAHVGRACEVSQGIFLNKEPSKINSCDMKMAELDLYPSYKDTEGFSCVSSYSPLLYMVSGTAMHLTSNMSGKTMFYAGRICNLFIWLLLITIAIKIMPVFKYPMMFTALLPMSVFEGMSFAADSFHNSFVFLFFAYIFKLIFEKKELNKRQLITLFIFSIISAMCKGVMAFPIFLFIFLPIKKHKYLFSSFCLLISMAITLYWMHINTIYSFDFASPEYHKYILLHQPLTFVKILLKTLFYNTFFYIRGCIGILGWLTIRLNVLAYILTSVIFMLQFIFIPEKINKGMKYLSISVFLLYILYLHVVEYIIVTPIDANKIMGMQGRYLLPIVPYLFLIFAQRKSYGEKAENYFKIFLTIYSVGLLIYTCILLYSKFQH